MITLIDEPEKETIEKESTIGFTSTPIPDANETCVQSTSKGNYKSEWYKNMTPEQREARRERQRLHNREPKRKEALKLSKKKIQRGTEAHPAPGLCCNGEPIIYS